MYDNLMSGVYSILEINVGIICVSMPAFRRFLAQLVPKCFGTTQNNSDPNQDDDTPNRPSKKRSKPSRSMLDASLFNTTMMRTVDVNLEESIGKADDEVHLVELHRSGSMTSTQNMNGSMRGYEEQKMPPSYCP
jgi:hypothetical protein